MQELVSWFRNTNHRNGWLFVLEIFPWAVKTTQPLNLLQIVDSGELEGSHHFVHAFEQIMISKQADWCNTVCQAFLRAQTLFSQSERSFGTINCLVIDRNFFGLQFSILVFLWARNQIHVILQHSSRFLYSISERRYKSSHLCVFWSPNAYQIVWLP